jgi:NitT/TauT family transport system substrate-binding protein
LIARLNTSQKRLCISLVLFVLCFSAAAPQAQEREKLRVSTLFIGSSLVPLWIGQEQGIFARNGVDVELIWMQSTLSPTALLAGEVDVVFGTPQAIFAVLTAKNAPPLVTIAAWGSASEHWLVVNPAIKSAKDLEGKTLGTSRPRSADHGYTILILERLGIDPRKVTFLSTDGQASRIIERNSDLSALRLRCSASFRTTKIDDGSERAAKER